MQQADQHTPHSHSSQAVTASNYFGWDRALARFLRSAGLEQALIGFESDILVLNLDTEKEDVLPALEQLRHDLTRSSQNQELLHTMEERKLEYIRLANAKTPSTHTQLNKSISAFIAQNRARNNSSNRNEFLGKRKRVHIIPDETAPEESSSMVVELPTCARTDAIPVNRDVQMKYDIAKNEGGPLRRTVKPKQIDDDAQSKPASKKGKDRASADLVDAPTLQKHPGLGVRFAVLEDHLAVRYVPSPPASLLDRLRFLEDHIVRLERDYPPWAALHFNQPHRGWPPPPRATPLIVPSHLTSTSEPPLEENEENRDAGTTNPTPLWPVERSRAGSSQGNTTKPRAKAKSSSLHRAVMQKLEVKKALAGD